MLSFPLSWLVCRASMKAPPKRKGNVTTAPMARQDGSLNESPSEKEGKYPSSPRGGRLFGASMKAPPKRKGNVC